MKLSWKWIAPTILLAGLGYCAFNLTRFRTATYECAQGPREIKLIFQGLPGAEVPYSGEFHMTGSVDEGELTVEGFPPDWQGKALHFMAHGDGIQQDYIGDWYDAPVSVRFKPDSAGAVCSIRIVYRMKNI